jgi:hypothetical protein
MLMRRHQTAEQNHNMTCNKSFGNMKMFKYFGTTVKDQNFICDETKSIQEMLATVQLRICRLPICCLKM